MSFVDVTGLTLFQTMQLCNVVSPRVSKKAPAFPTVDRLSAIVQLINLGVPVSTLIAPASFAVFFENRQLTNVGLVQSRPHHHFFRHPRVDDPSFRFKSPKSSLAPSSTPGVLGSSPQPSPPSLGDRTKSGVASLLPVPGKPP